jgi:hypothetical protein
MEVHQPCNKVSVDEFELNLEEESNGKGTTGDDAELLIAAHYPHAARDSHTAISVTKDVTTAFNPETMFPLVVYP